jgi:microtubule-associated protein 1
MSSNRNNEDNDSSFVSDIGDKEISNNAFEYDDKKVHEEFVKNVLVDKVSKYIKLDNIIKEKQDKLKTELKKIKDAKEQMEEYIISYLDKNDAEFLGIGNEKLIKTVKETKAPIKIENIEESLIEGFKKYELYKNDEEISKVVKDFLMTIDSKIKITQRKYLTRENNKKEDKKEVKKEDKKEVKKQVKNKN